MTIHSYLQTVTVTAVFCAVVRSLTDKTAQRAAVSMFCGICLLTAILLPLKNGSQILAPLNKELNALTEISDSSVSPAAAEQERLTREYAADAASACLETQFSALTGESCSVRVTLDDSLHPVSASLEAPSAHRETLLRLCAEALGLDADSLQFTAMEDTA